MEKISRKYNAFLELNRKAKIVYNFIRSYGKLTKFDLYDLTKIKSTTLTRLLEELLNNKLILEAGVGESTGGRKPIIYVINSRYACTFGLDLSRTESILVLSDLNMNVIDSFSWKMTNSMEPYYLFNKVLEKIEEMIRKNLNSEDCILGLGISAVGPLDLENRILLNAFDFPAPGWRDVPVCDYFEERLKFPVFLDNGACNALRAEYWGGISSQCQNPNLVFIHLGIGLRTAIMSNFIIRSGAIGQMIIQTDGLITQNPYGNYGSLHSYVTIHYIIKEAISRLRQGRNSILYERIQNIEDIKFPHLLEALNSSDPMVVEIFTQAATYFGIGLANIINILHPEKIILGGPLISIDLFYNTAVEVAKKKTYLYSYPIYNTDFCKSQMGNDGLALGAGLLVIDKLISKETYLIP